ncbi:MAG TPA: hypothetical protein DEH11_14465 [Actinobacteria bacterium]|nr:hypothetical protein [Actinomycetota bacterium]
MQVTDAREHDSRGALAARLLAAQRGLAAADLPAEARMRLHRRLAAVCDALKSPAADAAAAGRRLEAFLAALDRECAEKSAHRRRKDNSPS